MMNNMNNFGMNPLIANPIQMNHALGNNMGMDNMGMNNIGINNMGMNNIGMNNHLNLMDENALKVKNIIQPYENKIKELEEIIRQKDFEIAVLKDKLNSNGMNLNVMNPHPMNMMMPILNEKGKEITVSFINFLNKIIDKYTCYENDMAYKLFDKKNPNMHWNLIKYTCDEKKINPFLTIKENGIKEGSIIKIGFAINISFKDIYGTLINIAVDENYPIKKAIKYYLLRIGKEGCYKEFKFLYNAQELNIEDKTPIKNIFKNSQINAKILVLSKH